MTFKRYEAMKKAWQTLPPLAVTTLAIAKCLGLEMAAPQEAARPMQKSEMFYDESYYENSAATPWRQGGGNQLVEEFRGAGGETR